MKPASAWLPRTPFWTLVAHFVKRTLAGEADEGTESVSLGLGMVLAILASPGAFASLFLLDKYATLLQYFREQRNFDPYKASVADEYFFVVLSMTIIGLVMVLRWNRLFPDRRDFWNLAALPIPIYQVFLANFAALFGLAFLFAVVINAVSAVLFPTFVTMSDGSVAAFLRVGWGHWAAVVSASLFSFFAVFALVGTLMLVLPSRLFRLVSVAVRMLLVVALLTEFMSNLFLQLLSGRLPGNAAASMRFLPSIWFLGLYEKVAHTPKPALAHFGDWALIALAASLLISIAAYSLCYRRHFLRLAESFDTLGGARHGTGPRLPVWLGRVLFRTRFEQACTCFAVKVLSRSERHVMIFGGYLGVGLVIVAQTALDDASTALFAVPLLISFFLITGLRFAFDVPAALTANWVFQSAAAGPQPAPRAVARRFILLAALSWQPVLLLPWATQRLGWSAACQLTAMNMAFSALAVELSLWKYHQIAFTYVARTDSRQIVTRILGALVAVGLLVPVLAALERWTLKDTSRFGFIACLIGLAFYELQRRRRLQPAEAAVLTFEERPPEPFELLKLA
ncbi:MAG TPA: hypothetical protein VK604_26315 [Bryobacteraceae bacterium]|nr:hypothetical protein [Bryobacteraceae bacterium]